MKNKKRNKRTLQKKQSGITLIALVITIIVLIILAGVTITIVSGEDGIIAKAKLSAEKAKEAEDKQEQDLEDLAGQIESLLGDSSSSSGGETPPVRTPPVVQTHTLEEVYSSKILDSMQKWPSVVDGKVNPILTSYDSELTPITNYDSGTPKDQSVIGRNTQRFNSTWRDSNYTVLYSIEFSTNADVFWLSAIGSLRISIDELDGEGYKYVNEERYT